MKKFVAVLCLSLCAATLQAKDKLNPADFNVKIHISASQIVLAKELRVLVVDTVLNGKKVKLEGDIPYPHGIHSGAAPWPIIVPGDYQIRLKKDESEKDVSIIRQEYELLLPNGDTWQCTIIGISE
jgi:hypothetical protein